MKRASIFLCFLFFSVWGSAQKAELASFLTAARQNSPLLKDFEGQIKSLSLDSQLLRASLKTQVSGISNNYYAPVIKGVGYDDAITNGAQLSALVQVSRNIVGARSAHARFNALQIQRMTTSNGKAISEQDLKKAITDQYILTYGDQLQMGFSDEILTLLRSEDTILKIMTRRNIYKQTEYLSFAVVLQQQELAAAQLRMQYGADFLTLNYLAGISDTTISELQEPVLFSGPMVEIAQSVFYHQFELDSLRIKNDKFLAALNYRPVITILADGGYNSSLAYRPYKNWGTSAGINLSIPIYDGRQKHLQFSKIEIQEQNRQERKTFFINQHSQQVNQLRRQLFETEQLIPQIEKQIRYTETLIRSSGKLLSTGDVRITDFIISLNNYFTARNLLTQNHVSRLQILNQLSFWNR